MPALPTPADEPQSQPRQALSLLDSTSIIVGIIIGSAIYEISPTVAAGAEQWVAKWTGGLGSAWQDAAAAAAILGIWVLGGIVALLGAMCFAELGTAHPQAG